MAVRRVAFCWEAEPVCVCGGGCGHQQNCDSLILEFGVMYCSFD